MLEAMLKHAGSICPSHAQKCHVRTYERTQLTNASKTQDHHLLFLNARVGLWITLIASLGVTA
jgi:hypothetical protein